MPMTYGLPYCIYQIFDEQCVMHRNNILDVLAFCAYAIGSLKNSNWWFHAVFAYSMTNTVLVLRVLYST